MSDEIYPRHAELKAMAAGNAYSHDWHQPDGHAIRCLGCNTVVFAGEQHLQAGTVPLCAPRTPCTGTAPHHEIGHHPDGGQCISCRTVYPPTVEVSEEVITDALIALSERGFVTAVLVVRRGVPALSLKQCGDYVKQLRAWDGLAPGGTPMGVRYWRHADEDMPYIFRTCGTRAWVLGDDGVSWEVEDAQLVAGFPKSEITFADLPTKAATNPTEDRKAANR